MTTAHDSFGRQQHTNALISETSPYLLQHAHHPVNWLPWGPQAFAVAQQENKPIFLSIGYASCHWCHVMARESFEDPATADLLNRFFVPVKVDREERPDVDETYMLYVQSSTGYGGWPLSVWLTPDGKPFLGGTYFPPVDWGGLPAFKSVLHHVAEIWRTRRDEVLSASEEILAQLRAATASKTTTPRCRGTIVKEDFSTSAFNHVQVLYDAEEGGFGGPPKFPQAAVLDFLFRYHYRTQNKSARDMALHTLRAMASGGLCDQLGGGFHRYATDRHWRIPHFEKMLYDQAVLACTYVDAFKISGEAFFAEVARAILNYVDHSLTGPEGECFSAEDADSPLRDNPAILAEGAFYLWTYEEVQRQLGTALTPLFTFVYGVEDGGNVADDPQGHFHGQNILFLAHTPEEAATSFRLPIADVHMALQEARARLLAARSQRPPPAKDTKVLTSWNGLMISAFARAAMTLDSPPFLNRARQIAHYLRTHLCSANGQNLHHCIRVKRSPIPAFLEDYAFLIRGLLDLYEASFDEAFLNWAERLQQEQDTRLWDTSTGGYFTAGSEDACLPLRLKNAQDQAVPSGNAVAAANLIRLGRLTGKAMLLDRAGVLLEVFFADLRQHPEAMLSLVSADDSLRDEPPRFVLSGPKESPAAHALLQVVYERFIPDRLIMPARSPAENTALSDRAAPPPSTKTKIHLCHDGICFPPIASAETLRAFLDRVLPPGAPR